MLEYYKKSVYGRERLYLVDKDKAKAIEAMTSLKTIREIDLEALQSLGLEFKEVTSPILKTAE